MNLYARSSFICGNSDVVRQLPVDLCLDPSPLADCKQVACAGLSGRMRQSTFGALAGWDESKNVNAICYFSMRPFTHVAINILPTQIEGILRAFNPDFLCVDLQA